MIECRINDLPEGRRKQLKRMISREIRKQMTSQGYQQRKAEFLAQKKERATVESEPLQDEDKNNSYPPNFTKLEDENDRN